VQFLDNYTFTDCQKTPLFVYIPQCTRVTDRPKFGAVRCGVSSNPVFFSHGRICCAES